ncbi:MAG: glycosyltransferase family 4 protein [Lachnospiraceae bacterium]|jgi:glycosyltransferase involved in cell wall biosynthesis|nr:glycosyltransferase family 4 protein [Lachnospiraceae bacterium]
MNTDIEKERKWNYLFLANSTKPEKELYESREPYHISSFEKIPVETAAELGCEVYVGINRKFASEISCDHPNVYLRKAEIYRNPFHIGEVWRAYQNVMTILKEEKIDVIHCNTPIGGVLGRICGKRAGVKKIIYTAHGFHFYKGAPLLNWLLYYPLERWMAHDTDVLITMNQEDYRRAQKFHLKKGGQVCYMPGVGISLERYRHGEKNREKVRKSLGVSQEAFLVISSGDLVKNKNFGMAIRSIARCNDENIHLLICGKGPELKKLRRLAQTCGVRKQVHFLGFRNDMKELLQASDVFMMTSFREGLSRSVMEAMASGLPVVATRIRGNVDLIDENGGYFVAVNDERGAAKSIELLKENAMLRIKMGAYNKERVKNFSKECVQERMLEIYRHVWES